MSQSCGKEPARRVRKTILRDESYFNILELCNWINKRDQETTRAKEKYS